MVREREREKEKERKKESVCGEQAKALVEGVRERVGELKEAEMVTQVEVQGKRESVCVLCVCVRECVCATVW